MNKNEAKTLINRSINMKEIEDIVKELPLPSHIPKYARSSLFQS